MVRYLMFMSYIGSRYRGAAKQMGCERLIDIDSIQGAIETALHDVRPRSRIKPLVSISSRTDAGVHALMNSCQFDLQHPVDEIYNTEQMIRRMNVYFARCGHEIRISTIYPISAEFNCRRNARSRSYFYRIMVAKNYDEHKVPIAEMGRAWHVRGMNINIEAMKSASKLFLGGKKNFETYAHKNRTHRTINYVRELNSLNIEPSLPLMPHDPLSERFQFWQVNVNSKAFLYNQVRRIVGTLVGIASGVITERDAKLMLQIPNNSNWDQRIMMAPPQGLYLREIHYDKEELEKHIIKHENIGDDKQRLLTSIP